MPISALPTVPSTSNPATFSADMDGFLAALPTFRTEVNDIAAAIGVTGGTLGENVGTFLATPSSANLLAAVANETGTGSLVFGTSPTLVNPALGTPSALVGTNITGTAAGLTAGNATLAVTAGVSNGLKTATTTVAVSAATAPTSGQVLTASSTTLAAWATPSVAVGGVTGLGTGVSTFLATPSSANLLAAVTDETGTGSLVFATSPTLVTPALGTPSALVGTNITGTAAGLTAGVATTARGVAASGTSSVSVVSGAGSASNGGTVNITGGVSGNAGSYTGGPVVITGGSALSATNTGGAVYIFGGDNGFQAASGYGGSVLIETGGTTNAGSITLNVQHSSTNQGAINIVTAGNSLAGSAPTGSIMIKTGTNSGSSGGAAGNLTLGVGNVTGKINFVNASAANGSVATTLGSVGPSGSATTVQGWFAIQIDGVNRYIPYW